MSTPQKTYLYLGVDNLTFAEYVGKRIMYFRKKKGYTGAKLANRSRTTATSISRIEKGKNIVGIDVFYNISQALSISPEELFPPYQNGSGLAYALLDHFDKIKKEDPESFYKIFPKNN